jgi:hypothetical protein
VLQQIGEAIPGQHHAPIPYFPCDISIAVRQHSCIGHLPAVFPLPFGRPSKRAILVSNLRGDLEAFFSPGFRFSNGKLRKAGLGKSVL